MIDWRGVIGSSMANGLLALLFASVSGPVGYIVCADCGSYWTLADPEPPAIVETPSHLVVMPVEARVQPVVRSHTPGRINVHGPCPAQPPVDRLPAPILTASYARIDLQTTTVCVRVDIDGRIDGIRILGRTPRGATEALHRALPTLAFIPAVRDGAFTASWVLLRSGR